jgi:hypothetical protein
LDFNGKPTLDNELTIGHFQALRNDNELRNYINQKIAEREQMIKNQQEHQLELRDSVNSGEI